jgi:hypothetical protein
MENNFPPQGSVEWFAQRRGKFTGSEIEAICKPKGLGATGETYIYQKIAELFTNPEFDTMFSNRATDFGNEYEPLAFKVHEKRSKCVAEETGFLIHPELPYLGASPDRIIHRDGAIGVGESKSPFEPENHIKHCLIESADYFKAKFPKYYYQTLVEFMCVPDATFVDFISFDPRMNRKHGYFCFTFTPSKTDCQFVIDRAKEARTIMNQILTKLTTNK